MFTQTGEYVLERHDFCFKSSFEKRLLSSKERESFISIGTIRFIKVIHSSKSTSVSFEIF